MCFEGKSHYEGINSIKMIVCCYQMLFFKHYIYLFIYCFTCSICLQSVIKIFSCNFFLFIELGRVTLDSKIIQIPGTPFYNTSSVHCIVFLSPQVLYLPLPTNFPLAITTLLSMTMSFFLRK